MLEDAERQLDEFAYGRAEGSHLGFATSQQALIQGADMGVMASRHDGGHVQHRPDARRAGFGPVGTAVQATARLAFDGNQTEKSGHLISGGKQ